MFNQQTGIELCSKCKVTQWAPADLPESLCCPFCGNPSSYTVFSASSIAYLKIRAAIREYGQTVEGTLQAGCIALISGGSDGRR